MTKLAKSGSNGAALCAALRQAAARSSAPAPRARVAHAHQRCGPERHPSDQRARREHCSPHHSTCAHNTVPGTPQACSVLLHDHRPDERAHETPAQRPHPRAAMRAARSPRARHPQNVQRTLPIQPAPYCLTSHSMRCTSHRRRVLLRLLVPCWVGPGVPLLI